MNSESDTTPAGDPENTSAANWRRLKVIVADALELPLGERDAYLANACGDDTHMLAEARSLLAASDEVSDTFLDTATGDRLIGQRIGGCRVEAHIASGGMGAVYRAVQETTGQTVALKVIRPGAGGESWRQRFAHEVRILAQLQHPSIARIFDAGVHKDDDAGSPLPYFAMEFVDGTPLTTFVREYELDTRQIVSLMIDVCDGVHHAHQRGIIHRDLKPDNILVESTGQPKILDFGIARATDPEQSGTTQLTLIGQVIGTTAYMSPEQFGGDPSDIDIRSDVYTLGVILFELLAGRRPYDLDRVSLPEAARIVAETEPPRLGSIDRSLFGDLETIVAVALDKDRDRRYASASELAADLRRFLNDEVIVARPASALVQLRKFTRRHRGLVAGIIATALALVLGTAGTLWGMFDAIAQRDLAQAAERDAKDVTRFLEEMMTAADTVFIGRPMTMPEMLERSAPRIDKLFAERPKVRTRLHSAFGWNYFTYGMYDRAEQHMRTAADVMEQTYGATDPRTIAENARYCDTLIYLHRLDDAGPRIRATVATAERVLGPDSEQTLVATTTLANWHAARDELTEAETLYRKAIAGQTRLFSAEHSYTLASTNALGNVLQSMGRYTEARELYARVFETRRRTLGPEHSQTVLALGNLASALANTGDLEQALESFEKVLQLGAACWGANHPHMRDMYGNYAVALGQAGQFDKALQFHHKCYDERVRHEGLTDPETLRALNGLCVGLLEANRCDDALEQTDKLVAATVQRYGADDMRTGRALGTRADALAMKVRELSEKKGAGTPDEARTRVLAECKDSFRQALALYDRHAGPRHPSSIILRNNFGVFLMKDGDPRDAVPVLAQVVTDWVATNPELRSIERLMRYNLARSMFAADQSADAEREFLRAWSLPAHPKAPDEKIAGYLVQLYEAAGSTSQADEWRQRTRK